MISVFCHGHMCASGEPLGAAAARRLRRGVRNLKSDGTECAIRPQVVHEIRAGDPMQELLSNLDDTHKANCDPAVIQPCPVPTRTWLAKWRLCKRRVRSSLAS
jgi:hypothetical protein